MMFFVAENDGANAYVSLFQEHNREALTQLGGARLLCTLALALIMVVSGRGKMVLMIVGLGPAVHSGPGIIFLAVVVWLIRHRVATRSHRERSWLIENLYRSGSSACCL
jgi:hypothetical protein